MALQVRRHHQKTSSNVKGANENSTGVWSSLLDSVATGKRLAEKNLLILGKHARDSIYTWPTLTSSSGGTTESQREFLDVLADENAQTRRGWERPQHKRPPVANRFALGYTYQDILDADHDGTSSLRGGKNYRLTLTDKRIDTLARLSLYLLSDRNPAFSNLLEPLFTPETISNFLVVVLLDWEEPWIWARQLRDWIQILRAALGRLDNDCVEAMNDNMKQWTERRKGQAGEGSREVDPDVPIPLGPGEWDEPLGIPICCVCQGAEKTEILEREYGWKDDEFDFILQFMRTVLLKHGGSLIYTASSAPGSLHTLIRSSLDVHSLLQRNALKHNVIDRDKILVPPNWDSWGKIRPLGENFDIEGVSNAWSVDIQHEARPAALEDPLQSVISSSDPFHTPNGNTSPVKNAVSQVVSIYEQRIEDPASHQSSALQLGSTQDANIETPCQETQEFLASQLQVLERLKLEDDKEQKSKDAKRVGTGSTLAAKDPQTPNASRVNEHLGPVQFNMGGIQVDADDALKSLREREATRSPTEDSKATSPEPNREVSENFNSFFAGLMNRGSTPSAGTPRHDMSKD